MACKKIAEFVQSEVQATMDGYENDRTTAIEFVRDLSEREYSDVLTEREIDEAIRYCKALR